VIDPALDEFQRSFGAVLDPVMLRESADMLAGLRDLPRACEHRDFIPWNVLVGPTGALGVIDWEAGELRGVPAVDLIYFLSYLGFALDRALPPSTRMMRSYRTGVDPRTFTGAVHRECVSRYIDATGLDPAVVRPLRQFTWILHSRFEYRRLVADFGASPTSEVLRRSVLLRLWEEEVRRAREA
jgi:aminoglycoside phosphotransferase (APT) family kinase protein